MVGHAFWRYASMYISGKFLHVVGFMGHPSEFFITQLKQLYGGDVSSFGNHGFSLKLSWVGQNVQDIQLL